MSINIILDVFEIRSWLVQLRYQLSNLKLAKKLDFQRFVPIELRAERFEQT